VKKKRAPQSSSSDIPSPLLGLPLRKMKNFHRIIYDSFDTAIKSHFFLFLLSFKLKLYHTFFF
jgi:hypothetical protein